MKKWIVVTLFTGILILGGCSKKKEEAFQANLKTLATESFDLAADSETAGISYLDAWRTVIYDDIVLIDGQTYTDFNDALYAQKILFETDGTNLAIEKQQTELKNLFNEIKSNQIDKFSSEYETAKDFYLKSVEFSSFAIEPQGSYTSFSEGFSSRRDEILSKYSSVKIELGIE